MHQFINFKLKENEWWESQSFWLSWWTLPSTASWGHTLPKDTLLRHIPLKVTHRLDPSSGYPPAGYPLPGGYPQAGYPPPGGHLPAGYPPPGGYPPSTYPSPGGYPQVGYPSPLASHHSGYGSGHGHGGPSMGTLIAGGAAAAYGAHHLSHGGHHSSHGSHHMSHGHHHGKFKQGKFKHGKFGKHKKHGKHHGGKVLEVQEMEVILVIVCCCYCLG
ncbi:unnamed protein product [Camellia sinensis]